MSVLLILAVVMPMPAVPTLLAASPVPVTRDTVEMALAAKVREILLL